MKKSRNKVDQIEEALLPRVNKPHVIKAKEAIHMSNEITLLQRKAWNILLHNAYNDLPSSEVHHMRVADLVDRMRYHSKNEEHLKKALEGLARTTVKWDLLASSRQTRSWGVLSLLAEATIEDGVLTYSYGPILRKGLHNPRMYARISLAIQNEFRSKHALALYEVCVHWRRQESGCGETPWIPISKFRELMGIGEEQYTDFRRLNQRVIKEPLEEINDVTDLSVKADYKRRGRKVVAVKFRVWTRIEVTQKTEIQERLFTDSEDVPEIVADLIKAGLPEREAKEIWHQGWDYVNAEKRDHRADFVSYVREKIAILNGRPEGSVKNRVGFLIQAIREDYTDPVILAETKVQRQLNAAQDIRRLNERKEQVRQKWQEATHELCAKMIEKDGDILDAAVAEIVAETPFNRTFLKRGRTLLENYRSGAAIRSLIDGWIKEKNPNAFVSIDRRYRQQIAKIDEEIASLDPS